MSHESRRVLVEVCIASVSDARVAEAGGADRVELNAALELHGLTPSPGTLIDSRDATALPMIAMLRPRPGGFRYDEHEFRVMLHDAQWLVQHGADGIAFGVLTSDKRVDAERCDELIGRARSLGKPLREGFIFHRAFDAIPDRAVALEELIRLGFRRIMTSGGALSAMEGAKEIAKLIHLAHGRIEVLPAGGIRSTNVRQLVAATHCDQVHASVRTIRADGSIEELPKIASPLNARHWVTDPRLLAELVSAAH